MDTKIGPPGHLNFKKRTVRSYSFPLVTLSAYATKYLVDVTEVPLSCVNTKYVAFSCFFFHNQIIFVLFYNLTFSFVNFVAPFRERDSLLMFVGNSFDVFDEILYCPYTGKTEHDYFSKLDLKSCLLFRTPLSLPLCQVAPPIWLVPFFTCEKRDTVRV